MIAIKRFEFNFFGENTYVIHDTATLEAMIIDPGMMMDRECQALDSYIASEGLKVKYLVNTHIHVDHVAGDLYVEERYGVGLSASPLDAFMADRIAEQARMFHLRFEFPEKIRIDHPLHGGERLMLGDSQVVVIPVPGHSPGSIALYLPDEGCVFSGDALFLGSIGRTDLPGGDYATLIRSITDNLLTLPADTVVYPGHGPATTIAQESRSNPFL